MKLIDFSIALQNGDTALHIAAAMGRRKLTRVLLESGCNKDVKNKVKFSKIFINLLTSGVFEQSLVHKYLLRLRTPM